MGFEGGVFGVEICSFSFVLVVFFSIFVHFYAVLGSFFSSFFWLIGIVSCYHSICYSHLALLEIGFVWHIRFFSCPPGTAKKSEA